MTQLVYNVYYYTVHQLSTSQLSRIDFSLEKTQAICLAPARELARQIMDNVRDMGKYTQVTTVFAIKGKEETD